MFTVSPSANETSQRPVSHTKESKATIWPLSSGLLTKPCTHAMHPGCGSIVDGDSGTTTGSAAGPAVCRSEAEAFAGSITFLGEAAPTEETLPLSISVDVRLNTVADGVETGKETSARASSSSSSSDMKKDGRHLGREHRAGLAIVARSLGLDARLTILARASASLRCVRSDTMRSVRYWEVLTLSSLPKDCLATGLELRSWRLEGGGELGATGWLRGAR